MPSPCSTLTVSESAQTIPVPSVCETTCFHYQNWEIIMFSNSTMNRLGFGGTATGHFHFRNNEKEDMLVQKSNPVGLGLLHIRSAEWKYTFPFLIYSAESSVNVGQTEELEGHNTQSNYSFLYVRVVINISWRHVCKVFKYHWHWLQTLNKQLSRYSPQYCIKLERKHIDEHRPFL